MKKIDDLLLRDSEEKQNSRRFSVRFSGVGKSVNINGTNTVVTDEYHDGKMTVQYCYLFNSTKQELINKVRDNIKTYGSLSYNTVFGLSNSEESSRFDWKKYSPFILNFTNDHKTIVAEDNGLYFVPGVKANNYSIYRREYEVFGEHPVTNNVSSLEPWEIYGSFYESKGEWQPVIINSRIGQIRDFNIQADKTYQYILYPSDYLDSGAIDGGSSLQIFANYDGKIYKNKEEGIVTGGEETAWQAGQPVSVNWNDWNIIELIPLENEKNVPIVQKTYRVNLDQMWFFKYALEVGNQTQNISRNEFQTLGKYPKIGYGQSDYISGSVTAMLGSEIRPYRGDSYVERLRMNRGAEQQINTTNERALMLKQWRSFVASKNPKLLRDKKGQSWIVQIMSGSNTPKDSVKNQPDTISFEWKQIDSVDNIIIYGLVEEIPSIQSSTRPVVEKTPIFKNKLF